MIEIRVAAGCGPTAGVLQRLVEAEGVRVGAPGGGIVSWGVPLNPNKPALNANAGRLDKMRQLVRLREKGVACLEVLEYPPQAQDQYPLIARQLNHVAGRDIRVCLQPEDAQFARQHGANFFTKFIPRKTEFRVWIYRRRHLGTYEKFLSRPERYRRFGCNYRNGWAFRLLNEAAIPRNIVDLGGRAVDALGLDFGACDILVPTVGQPVVLEVNTAPGVEGDGRQVIRALARRIANWERFGYKKRNGADDAQ